MGLSFSPFHLFGTRSVNLIALHLHIGAGLFIDCMHWNQEIQCFLFRGFLTGGLLNLVGGLEHLLFFRILGIIIQLTNIFQRV